ncbi:MAG: GNAT family N-acetyltransferase [Bacteroidota bacterium]
MEIKHREEGHKGSFYIEADGLVQAEMTYSMAGDTTMIIDHTEVGDSLRGKGAGLQLVMAGVEYSRKNGLKIIPLCPFAKSVFDKKTEIQDVLR